LQNSLGDNLRYVFRYFPLDDIHPHAMGAALAAEAAAAQGKFWPMYGALFENQEALSHAHLLQYAKHIRLDEEEFARAMKSEDIRQRVHADVESGKQSGAHGTPTIFVNGQGQGSPSDIEDVLDSIESQLPPIR
jgi:protein-disulfide isomerase